MQQRAAKTAAIAVAKPPVADPSSALLSEAALGSDCGVLLFAKESSAGGSGGSTTGVTLSPKSQVRGTPLSSGAPRMTQPVSLACAARP